MRHTIIVICLALFFSTSTSFAQDHPKEAKQSDKVKVSAKDLAEIKRQIRLMRAEMADLEEKIEQITGLHDAVYQTEKESGESKPAPASDHSE